VLWAATGSVGLLAALPAGAGAAVLNWSVPEMIDPQAPFQGPNDAACTDGGLCVVVDGIGNVFTSTDPAGGAATWTKADVDGSNAIEAVSCPSSSFCAAADSAGDVLTSTNPTGGAGAWAITNIDGDEFFEGISCPSAGFCGVVGEEGVVLTSTDPTGGESAWSKVEPGDEQLYSIGCASESFCLAGNFGSVLFSTTPAVGSSWSTTHVDRTEFFGGAACPSTTLCVVADADERVAVSTDPTGGESAWQLVQLPGTEPFHVSCPSTSLCVAGGNLGTVGVSANPAGGAGAWEVQTIDTVKLFGLGCASTHLCVAVDGFGNFMVGTGRHQEEEPTDPGGTGDNGSTEPATPSDNQSGAATPSPSPPPPPIAVTRKPKSPKCRKGFKKRRVHANAKCVKVKKKHRRH